MTVPVPDRAQLAEDVATSPIAWPESVASVVDQVALTIGATCLVETRDGRLVAHSVVGPVPDAAVSAILARRSHPLQSAVGRRRTVAVSRGGGVQELELQAWPGRCLTSPIVAMGSTLGWLWVLLERGRDVAADVLAACTEDLALAATETATPDRSALAACLQGAPGGELPRRLREATPLWVVAVQSPEVLEGSTVAGLLELALRERGAAPGPCAAAAIGSTAYLVLAAPDPVAAAAAVDDVLSRSELPLRAGLSDPVTRSDRLSGARVQADEVLAVAPVSGRTVSLPSARPAIALRHLYRSLEALPDLGRHPLAQLLDYDARHGGDLAPTLLCWLDAHGDRLLVAESLGIHTNTVAYRVGRARTLLDVDLDDPTVRLELHLRLRAALLAGVRA